MSHDASCHGRAASSDNDLYIKIFLQLVNDMEHCPMMSHAMVVLLQVTTIKIGFKCVVRIIDGDAISQRSFDHSNKTFKSALFDQNLNHKKNW